MSINLSDFEHTLVDFAVHICSVLNLNIIDFCDRPITQFVLWAFRHILTIGMVCYVVFIRDVRQAARTAC